MLFKKFITPLFIVIFHFSGHAQICSSYKIVPDTVSISQPTIFSVQEILIGGPPTLWVCQWIDFENNGIQNCVNTSSCTYSFTSGGLHQVSFQIHEPFLGNTEVCTSSVYVNACNTGYVTAKANNTPDSLMACIGTPILLSLNLQGAQNCPGTWKFAWFNGTYYYDGMGFLSTEAIWDASFAQIGFSQMNIPTTYTGKVKCSTFNNCTDSSKVYIGIKPAVQALSFAQNLIHVRCQSSDTITYTASALYTDSIKYTIDTISLNNGCYINPDNGILYFNNNHTGITQITAKAYGCNGPISATYLVNTHSMPLYTIPYDTSFLCQNTWLNIPISFSGTPPFEFIYNNALTNDTINTNLHQYSFEIFIDTSTTFHFLSLKDNNCINNNIQQHHVLTSPKPISHLNNDTIICAHAYILLDAGSGYDSYTWSHGNSTTHTLLLDTSVSGIQIGSNTIYVDITNAYCQITDSIQIIFSICTKQFNNSKQEVLFQVYPTISTGLINIVLQESMQHTDLNFQIIDLSGKVLYNYNHLKNSDLKHEINIPIRGSYLLKISNKKELLFIEKIIIN